MIKKIIAFDTGQGNMMIDQAVRTFYGRKNMIRMVFMRQGKMISSVSRKIKKETSLCQMDLQKLLVKIFESTIRKNFLSITLMMQTTLFIP